MSRRSRPNASGGSRNEKVDRPARARFSNWTPPWLQGRGGKRGGRGGGRGGGRDGGRGGRGEEEEEDSGPKKKNEKKQMYGPKPRKRVQAPSYLLDPAIAAARASRAAEARTAELHQRKIEKIDLCDVRVQ